MDNWTTDVSLTTRQMNAFIDSCDLVILSANRTGLRNVHKALDASQTEVSHVEVRCLLGLSSKTRG